MTTPEEIPESGPEPEARGRRGRWQVGMWGVLLLTAAVAPWIAAFVNQREVVLLRSRLAMLRMLTHELTVDDPTRIAVVKRQELWLDDDRWDVHLPTGAYRICLATREIPAEGPAPAVASGSIAAGRHWIALERTSTVDRHRVVVTVDGKPLLTAEEPKAWYPEVGYSGGGEFSSTSTQPPAGRPVELYHRRFNPLGPQTNGPSEGLLLWIEPAPPTP